MFSQHDKTDGMEDAGCVNRRVASMNNGLFDPQSFGEKIGYGRLGFDIRCIVVFFSTVDEGSANTALPS